MSDLLFALCLLFAACFILMLAAISVSSAVCAVFWWFERGERRKWQEYAGLLEHKMHCEADDPDDPDDPDDDGPDDDILGLDEWREHYKKNRKQGDNGKQGA